MMFIKSTVLAFAASAFFSLASATTYAQFCNDGGCNDGCGLSVSVDNPGCLEEHGRQSVKYHGPNFQEVALVTSPDSKCSCQNYCYDHVVGGTGQGGVEGCQPLTGPPANSYRFVGNQACEDNNC